MSKQLPTINVPSETPAVDSSKPVLVYTPDAKAVGTSVAEPVEVREQPVYRSPVERHFPYAPRSIWTDATDAEWSDWRWQQRHRITTMAQLEKVIRVSPSEREGFEKTSADFHMGITPYYASLMDVEDPSCPVRQQSVPVMGELSIYPEDLEDPLGEEKDMPVPGVTHRYVPQVAQTDWEFLRGRAREIGYDVGVSGGEFFFRPAPGMSAGGIGGALATTGQEPEPTFVAGARSRVVVGRARRLAPRPS